MTRSRPKIAGVRLPAWMLVLATVAACSTTPVEPPIVVEEAPPEVVEPEVPVIEAPPPVPEEPPPIVVVEDPREIAIVVANRTPAYVDVVDALLAHFERFSIYDLSDKSQPPPAVFRRINDSKSVAVIAVGLGAARLAVAMADAPVIFTQVFNYREHGLVTGNSRGVASIAPPSAQLAAWKSADPTLSRLGIIVGEGHDDLLEDVEIAAAELGLNVDMRVARSDQEMLYLYRRIAPDIDGFWLLPDNRVLSSRVLEEILGDTGRRGVSVAVPTDALLPMGASIAMLTEASDIAATIASIVQQVELGHFQDLPAITPLSEIRVVVRGGEDSPVALNDGTAQ